MIAFLPLVAALSDVARADSPEEILRRDLDAIRMEVQAGRAERDALRAEILRLEALAVRPGAPAADRVAYGDVVRVASGERAQEVVAFGDDVHIEGYVAGDATSFGGSVYVGDGGIVEGDAIAFGGQVHVADAGLVRGGRITLDIPGMRAVPPVEVNPAAASIGAFAEPAILETMYRRMILMLSFAGAGVLVVGLVPRRVSRIAANLEQGPVRAAVVGLLGSSFLTLFSVLFAILTFGLGLPVSLVLVGALGLAWLLGFVGLCQTVGDRLPFQEKPHGRWLAFLIGTLLVSCVGSLPVVGWLVVGAASMVGVGAALSSRFGAR